MKLKTLKDLRIEEELCEKLDSEVYLPVKKELEGIDRTYSLGAKKEDFKGFIEKKIKELRQEAIKCVKIMEKIGKKKYGKKYKRQFLFMHFFNITEEDLK